METLIVPPRTPQSQPHQRGHRHRRSAAISGDFDIASFQQPPQQPQQLMMSRSMPSSPLKPSIVPLANSLGSPKLFITEETRYSHCSPVPDAVIDLSVINRAQKDFIMEEEDDDIGDYNSFGNDVHNELVPNFTEFEMLSISNSSSSSLNNPPFNTPSTGSLKARYQSYYKIGGTPSTPKHQQQQQNHHHQQQRISKKTIEVKSPFQYQPMEYNPPVEEQQLGSSPTPHERTSSLFSLLSKTKKMVHKNRNDSIIEQTTSEELLDSTLADITITEDSIGINNSPIIKNEKIKSKKKGVWSWIRK